MSIFDIFKTKPKQRGLVSIEGVGGGLLNKGEIIDGEFECEILEETEDMYHVKFKDYMIERDAPSHWLKKELVKSLLI
jgi:hypothetical protein